MSLPEFGQLFGCFDIGFIEGVLVSQILKHLLVSD